MGAIALTILVISPASAQITIPDIFGNSNSPQPSPSSQPVDAWVRLDGRRLFKITATDRNSLLQRLATVETRLRTISQQYFAGNAADINVEPQLNKNNKNSRDIVVDNQTLLTITPQDAKLQGESDVDKYAQTIATSLEQELKTAKQERQASYLRTQGAIAGGILCGMVLTSWAIRRWQHRIKLPPIPMATMSTSDAVSTQLSQQQQRNIQEIRQRLSQLAQAVVWGGGTLLILRLFPYTRIVPVWLFMVLKDPMMVGLVALGTYVVIRLSYVLIDRSTSVLVNNTLMLTQEDSLRLQLRVATISGVTKSIATLSGFTIGALVALSVLGVNIVPILTGASLIGVGISLASQNLIKDAINGFLIILEDQYAIGDVINVGTFGGLVENLNLRITQLRDSEGRLITIPNSEIKTVANLSSRWSRADLNIPISYNTDIDAALNLIKSIGLGMDGETQWQDYILEPPQVLGVEQFSDRGLMIRVWIKTQPLKQWEVAREYRRRIKIAFDSAGIDIPLPQQSVWLNEPGELSKAPNDGKKLPKER
ncbi:mechanosensitive ion channel protein MscS [Aliterella atlantica CENA595]|uniref:Mechanosensitive ion channel protein MscS n=2 Tax=Aliterella TaxID=1827277 RepID=A0A0D8ZM50_9CYAN|nr:mechanosensitive ion channel protein MscS [Aliterella atlantica CENA595]